ncbi:MAG: hypothetical protein AAF570_06510, partial [Bacteroidota bacterium]
MNHPFEVLSEIGTGFTQSFFDFFLGRETTRESFPDRAQFRMRFYRIMGELWSELYALLPRAKQGFPSEKLSEKVDQAFHAFRTKANEIFEEFEVGKAYDGGGAMERAWQSLGNRFHQLILGTGTSEKDLQYGFEQCWNHFFALVREKENEKEVDPEEIAATSIAERTSGFFIDPIRSTYETHREGDRAVDYRLDQLVQEDRTLSLSNGEKSQLSRIVSEKIAPDLALRLADSMRNHMTGKLLMELSPSLGGLLRFLLAIQGRIYTELSFETFYDLHTLGLMSFPFTSEKAPSKKKLDQWEAEKKHWEEVVAAGGGASEFAVAITKYLDQKSVEAPRKLMQMTGIWVDHAANAEAIQTAARRLAFRLQAISSSKTQIFGGFNGLDTALHASTANRIAAPVAAGVAIMLDAYIRTILHRHLRIKLEVPYLSKIDFLDAQFNASLEMELNPLLSGNYLEGATTFFVQTCIQIAELSSKTSMADGSVMDKVMWYTHDLAMALWDPEKQKKQKKDELAFRPKDLPEGLPEGGMKSAIKMMTHADVRVGARRRFWLDRIHDFNKIMERFIRVNAAAHVTQLLTAGVTDISRLEGLAELDLVDSSFITVRQGTLFDVDFEDGMI